MIRTACLVALAAVLSVTSQSASATVNLNDRIGQIINGLRKNVQFSARDFSMTINTGRTVQLFSGIEGIRVLNGTDFTEVNDLLGAPTPGDVFNGGSYSFTHSVVDSFFGNGGSSTSTSTSTSTDADTETGDGTGTETTTNPVFEGAPYKFTHTVLDSYFEEETTSPTPQSLVVEQPTIPVAVPEPASWAMMIGGFALAGAALRSRRALRIA